jgi:hypothetical protein
MAEYHMPVHLDVPAIEVHWIDIPDRHAPTGARGVGEIAMTGQQLLWQTPSTMRPASAFVICQSRSTNCSSDRRAAHREAEA